MQGTLSIWLRVEPSAQTMSWRSHALVSDIETVLGAVPVEFWDIAGGDRKRHFTG